MKKIGGVNMNTITRLTQMRKKDTEDKRYCTVYESLEDSLKEVKLIREGKIQPKMWDELFAELKNNKG